MKLILDVDSPVERGCLPIFAPLLPMKHAFCLARSTFSLFSLPLPSPSFILTIGQRNVSLSFLFACFYLVADHVGSRNRSSRTVHMGFGLDAPLTLHWNTSQRNGL